MSLLLGGLLTAFHARKPIRAGSLIVTVFGDVIVPRGGSLSLASLTEIMGGLGIGDGLVRTALSRLVAEGWFDRRRRGRHSFYQLTSRGQADFAQATRRIYGARRRGWDGTFDLVLLEDERDAGRASLLAQGYAQVSPGLLVSPDGVAFAGAATRLTARADPGDARRLAARAWPLDEVDGRYRRFIGTYGEIERLSVEAAGLDSLAALVLRVLIVHDYRRVVLKDPALPADLLPPAWSGSTARALVARVYRRLVPASERWLDEHATGWAGCLPKPDRAFAGRFAEDQA